MLLSFPIQSHYRGLHLKSIAAFWKPFTCEMCTIQSIFCYTILNNGFIYCIQTYAVHYKTQFWKSEPRFPLAFCLEHLVHPLRSFWYISQFWELILCMVLNYFINLLLICTFETYTSLDPCLISANVYSSSSVRSHPSRYPVGIYRF